MRPLPRSVRSTAAVAAAVLALGLVAGCGDDDNGTTTGEESPSAGSDTSTSAGATTEPSEDGTTADDAKVVPAYFVGDTPQGERLYREFTQVDGMDPLVGAGAAVTQGDPIDPDYRSLWPKGSFESITQTADAIEVVLPDDGWLTAGSLDKKQARLAVQQLVYTLQGAAGRRLPLHVTLDDKPAPTLLGVDASRGLKAAPELDVMALVNITEPAQGATVSGTFTATGRSSSFEATVPWEIQDSTGAVVLTGSTTAEGWMDKLYPWEVEIDATSLEPGSYTLVARTDDPSEGEGGGPTEDTKKITIE